MTKIENTPPPIENSERENIELILDQFLHALDGIRTSQILLLPLLSKICIKTIEEFDKFVESNEMKFREDDGSVYYRVDATLDHDFREKQRTRRQYTNAMDQTPRALFVAMFSAFDAYLGNLLRALYYKQPKLLDSSGRSITFSELVEFESIEDARSLVIDSEVEAVLRSSYIEQFRMLEKRFNIELRKGLDCWLVFVEAGQRRNLFVHNDGVVSAQYLKVCKENGIDVAELSVGDELKINQEYLKESFFCVHQMSIKLSHVLWRKVCPEDQEKADNALIKLCFELLQQEKFKLAKPVLDFSVDLKKHHNAFIRRINIVNKAIGYKFNPQLGSCSEILDNEDWSDCGKQFLLAVEVLRENYSSAAEIMEQIGSLDEHVTKMAYRTWPLFIKFRSEEIFMDTYRRVFDEEFILKESELDDRDDETSGLEEVESENEA